MQLFDCKYMRSHVTAQVFFGKSFEQRSNGAKNDWEEMGISQKPNLFIL
jgi:hypothetical protein